LKVEKLNKPELDKYCKTLGIDIKKKKKSDLLQAVHDYQRAEIDEAITSREGMLIDEYQNTGRFLYKYAGSFLEEAASLCLFFANSQGAKTTIKNTQGIKPKTFEIDFLNGNDAIELKWRDATTDGDHIIKEHTRVKAIKNHGYKPIRVMFYYPQREQAIKIQETLKTIYIGVGGEYYAGDEAWNYLTNITSYDLKAILTEIAQRKDNESKDN
jgi:hypothetical protein